MLGTSATSSGGALGLAVSKLFLSLFDVYVSVIFLSALFIISLLVIFDRRPNIANWFRKIILNPLSLIFKRKRKEVEEISQPEADQPLADNSQFPISNEKKEKAVEEISNSQFPISNEKKGGKKDLEIGNLKLEISGMAAYVQPPLSLLERDSGKPNVGDIKSNSNIIKRTLQNFGIEVEMDEVTIGPTITRYSLKPAEGVKLSRIVALQNDLSLALAAYPIRIEAPIPGKSLLGIEIPNKVKSIVGLASLLSDERYQKANESLLIAIGKRLSGKSLFADIAKMPHLLISGSTGSGKSIMIHSMIISLLYRNSPEFLRFILIDPKRVELPIYNKIPHLLTPVITAPKKAILSLKWAIKEMEKRYNIFEAESVRNIESYHSRLQRDADSRGNKKDESNVKGQLLNVEELETLPYIVIIIDELADIMSTYPRELEAVIVRLAQMSRATGIHLILSTQRPSVNVITGLIKANISTRIAFQVASQVDSRTILDTSGAEKLLGAGDMLYLSSEMAQPERLQSAYISEDEVKKVVKFITKNNEAVDEVPPEIDAEAGSKPGFSMNLDDDNSDDDELYEDARMAVIEAGKASTSYLQRKLKLGYSRAARLMDMLEERGVIGGPDGARPREVLEKAIDNIDDGSANKGFFDNKNDSGNKM
jgi:S-DNA-T family DNA segregation ATPase FtsK/SpoIIIE